MRCINNGNIWDCILLSLSSLVQHDLELIERSVKEECINHRFAHYIELSLLNLFDDIDDVTNTKICVDVEYNKNMSNAKSISSANISINIRPDILVHERLSNENNIMVVECKMLKFDAHAKLKLKQLALDPYNYKYCLCLVYRPSHEDMKLHIFNRLSSEFNSIYLNKTRLTSDEYLSSIKSKIACMCCEI